MKALIYIKSKYKNTTELKNVLVRDNPDLNKNLLHTVAINSYQLSIDSIEEIIRRYIESKAGSSLANLSYDYRNATGEYISDKNYHKLLDYFRKKYDDEVTSILKTIPDGSSFYEVNLDEVSNLVRLGIISMINYILEYEY